MAKYNSIDPNAVVAIINKLKLQISREERIVTNIKNALNELEANYSGNNSSKIKAKKNNIANNLDVIISNKQKCVKYIDDKKNTYMTTEWEVSQTYKNKTENMDKPF